MNLTLQQHLMQRLHSSTPPSLIDPPFTVLASPSWRGVDGRAYLVQNAGQTYWLKHYLPATAFYIDLAATLQAATAAGKLQIGPTVYAAERSPGYLLMDYLAQPWQVAGLEQLHSIDFRQQLIDLKKHFQQHGRATAKNSIFGQIRTYAQQIQTHPLLCPKALPTWLIFNQQAEALIQAQGMDLRPCHCDGNISNVMFNQQQLRLLDFDMACITDPFEDLGCYLMEGYELKTHAQSGFEQWQGYFSQAEFERAWLYGVLDDLRWGLIAMNVAARSPTSHLEFAKYGSWRLLRFQHHARHIAI
jgi:hypothetical protein